jgi:hypothetical protein
MDPDASMNDARLRYQLVMPCVEQEKQEFRRLQEKISPDLLALL